jgi:hypothetical protein
MKAPLEPTGLRLGKNTSKRLNEQGMRCATYPRLVEIAPANVAKRARKAAGVTGAKASKAFRRAHRAIGVPT